MTRRRARLTAKLLCSLALAALPSAAGEMSRVIRAEGKGYLEQVGGHLVLHVAGTPYEMGWQHGRLLRKQVRAAIGSLARRQKLLRLCRARRTRVWPSVPGSIADELRGLADGAGVAREAVELAHLLPEQECMDSRSAAAWGAATAGRRLYHAHSIGVTLIEVTRPMYFAEQCHGALLIVAKPAGGVPHAYPSEPGYVNVLTGMNAEGISLGATARVRLPWPRSGMPVPFLAKETLCHARTLDDAIRRLSNTRRPDNANYVVGDSAIPAAAAVEVTPSVLEVMRPGDPEAVAPPHLAIPDLVIRTNHFLHPRTAATRRRSSDPAREMSDSLLRYWTASQLLARYRGRLDARRMRHCLAAGPPGDIALSAIVCCPAERVVWLASRGGMGRGGEEAREWKFHRLPLSALLTDQRFRIVVDSIPTQHPAEGGICTCDDTLKPLSDPDPKVNELLGLYNFPPEPFPWRMRLVQDAEKYEIRHLTFPSPTRFDMLECNTVHGEYYLPKPAPAGAPGLIVLHILDGRFLVSRMICRHFAAMGIPCLMVQMPYYGERRPRGTGLADVMLVKPRRMFDAMQAAVPDVRRAACWLQKRPEVDSARIGVMGVSLGAIAGALVVGVDPRFNRNVLVIGGGDPAAIVWHAPETQGVRARLQQLGYTRESLAQAIQAVDPIVFAHRVNPRQVLLVNAIRDKTIPRQCTVSLWKAMGKPIIRWHPAGHYSLGLFVPIILPNAYNFVRNLPPPATP